VFAARNNGDYKYSGSDKVESVAFFDLAETKDVAQKKPNGFGLYDMSGNVWEWCSDWYAIYTDLDEENPTGPNSGESHVLRGGAWNDNARSCRVFRRKPGLSSYKDNSIGLRLVLVDYKD
jgi:formylglycine-generating enzyme required for sulfatase activity